MFSLLIMDGFSSDSVVIEMSDSQDLMKCDLCAGRKPKTRTPTRTAASKVFCQHESVPHQFGSPTASLWSTSTEPFECSRPTCLQKSGITNDDSETTTFNSVGMCEKPAEIDMSSREEAATAGTVCLCPHQVQFSVGQEKQLVTAPACQLAAVSPVFRAMFSGRWKRATIELPDVKIDTFTFIIRHSSSSGSSKAQARLSENTVWEILFLADRFQVLPLVHECFHFLMHHHRRRDRSRHICTVLEMAHQLNHLHQHAECLQLAKRRAKHVFKNASALNELCSKCMKELVSADDLDLGTQPSATEGLVQEAVITWARGACAKRGLMNPGVDELREEAGEMVFDVRYTTLPSYARSRLLLDKKGRAALSSLLTQDEVECLLHGTANVLPKSMQCKRRKSSLCPSEEDESRCCGEQWMSKVTTKLCVKSVLQCVGLFIFLFAVIYVPVAVLKNLSAEHSPMPTTFLKLRLNTTRTNLTHKITTVIPWTETENSSEQFSSSSSLF